MNLKAKNLLKIVDGELFVISGFSKNHGFLKNKVPKFFKNNANVYVF